MPVLIKSCTKKKESNEDYVSKILKELLPIKRTVGICSKDDDIFVSLQKTIVKYFSNSPGMKMLRCTKILKHLTCKETLLEIIEQTRLKENPRRLVKTFLELKDMFYFPNFRLEILKYINNCIFCNMCKYDRHPIKPN